MQMIKCIKKQLIAKPQVIQKMRRLRRFFLLLVLFCCISLPIFHRSQAQMMLIRDAEIENILTDMLRKVFVVAGLKQETAKIFVILSDSINAFTIGGGYVFITSGLILKFQDLSKIMAILSHETAHIALKHIEILIKKLHGHQQNGMLATIAAVLTSVVTRSSNPLAVLLGYYRTDAMFFLSYSRDQEMAADDSAANYMKKLKYPLQSLIDVFSEFERIETLNSTNDIPVYVRSHPSAYKRIEIVRKHISNSDNPKTIPNTNLEAKFLVACSKLKIYCTRDSCKLKEDDFEDPYSKAMYFHKKGKLKEAINILVKSQSSGCNDIYHKEQLARVYFESQKIEESIALYESICNASKNSENIDIIKIDYANVLLTKAKSICGKERTQISKKVIDMLSPIIEKESDGSVDEIYKIVGEAYALIDDHGMSNLMFAYGQYMQQNYDIALTFVKKAKRLLKGSKKMLKLENLEHSINDKLKQEV